MVYDVMGGLWKRYVSYFWKVVFLYVGWESIWVNYGFFVKVCKMILRRRCMWVVYGICVVFWLVIDDWYGGIFSWRIF